MYATDGIMPHVPSWSRLDFCAADQQQPREQPVSIVSSLADSIDSLFAGAANMLEATGQAIATPLSVLKDNLLSEDPPKRKLPSDFKDQDSSPESTSPESTSPVIESHRFKHQDPSLALEQLASAYVASQRDAPRSEQSKGCDVLELLAAAHSNRILLETSRSNSKERKLDKFYSLDRERLSNSIKEEEESSLVLDKASENVRLY